MRISTKRRDAIRAELLKLRSEGQLTPDSVIRRARNPKSPLHSCFTWDMRSAALKTLRQEARQLIASFSFTVEHNHKSYVVQEFVERPGKEDGGQGYVAFSDVMTDKALAQEFIDRELGVASTYVAKTRDYAELLGMRKRVDGLVRKIDDLRIDARERATA